MQSIFAVSRPIDIHSLICEQPTPTTFFKVFLELDLKCLLPFLSFDARSIKELLSEENDEFFDEKQPIIFRDSNMRSAIDEALGENQLKSVQ